MAEETPNTESETAADIEPTETETISPGENVKPGENDNGETPAADLVGEQLSIDQLATDGAPIADDPEEIGEMASVESLPGILPGLVLDVDEGAAIIAFDTITRNCSIVVPLPVKPKDGYVSHHVTLDSKHAIIVARVGEALRLRGMKDMTPGQVIGWLLDQVD